MPDIVWARWRARVFRRLDTVPARDDDDGSHVALGGWGVCYLIKNTPESKRETLKIRAPQISPHVSKFDIGHWPRPP